MGACRELIVANRLAESTSPYLLQHEDNPVDWWEWGPEAFEEARRRDVPVLLSVGYAACHWCHVMAHESFEDAATAALMNEHFVNVKVDREERPDVDAVYMDYVQAMTGHGGWPMTTFLDPGGRGVLRRHVLPADPAPRDALVHAAAHRDRRHVGGAQGRGAAGRARGSPRRWPSGRRRPTRRRPPDGGRPGRRGAPAGAGRSTRPAAGSAAHPSSRRRWCSSGCSATTPAPATRRRSSMASRTFEAMARGGMYDQLGGGFARYSVDADWVVPHFEKMLYDNALLLRVYLHWWRATGRSAGRAGRRGDGGVPAPRPAHARGRLRLRPRRRHRRGRGR